jgi:hypothetical protein
LISLLESSKVATPDKKNQFKVLPDDILNIVGKYIDILDISQVNLKFLEYLIEVFRPPLYPEKFRDFLLVYILVTKKKISKFFKCFKTWFPTSPYLNDQKYLSQDTIYNLSSNKNLDLLKLIIEMYKPNMIEKFLSYVFHFNYYNELEKRDIFEFTLEILKCIFDQIKDLEELENFFISDRTTDLYFVLYLDLLLTLDREKIFYIHSKFEPIFSDSYHEFYGNSIEDHELIIKRTLYGALVNDDLKLADFIWNGEFLFRLSPKDDKFQNIGEKLVSKKCAEGNLDTIRYIHDQGIYNIKDNTQKFISIAKKK